MLRAVCLLGAGLAARAAAPAPTDVLDIFVAGSPPEISNYRIPSLARTAKGTLVAVVEARTSMSDCGVKWLAFSRSEDEGRTWSTPAPLWGENLTDRQGAGNPVLVFDNVTGTLLLHASVNDPAHCSPSLYTFQLDDGGSDGTWWGHLMNLSAFIHPWDGATPGPGTGTQMGPHSHFPGRLIVPAHYGAYEDDVSWYSDNHGSTWALSSPPLPNLDEVVVVALPSGRVMLNARTDHYNATCKCRARTTSEDGGATWATPITWDATLIEPVCQASLVTIGPLSTSGGATALFFSNPASTSARQDLTVRRSDDEGVTWPYSTLVHAGTLWGGYSCIASGAPVVRSDGGGDVEYGAIIFEWQRGATYVISFTLFPVALPPAPPPPPPPTFIPASHPSVQWSGRRVVHSNDGSVSFDFPGVTAVFPTVGSTFFTARFSSTCPGGPRLESALDGGALGTTLPGAFWLWSSFAMPHTVELQDGLDGGAHNLTIRLATEARWGACNSTATVTLDGIWTDGMPATSPLPPASTLEWVGDSITAGFGTAPRGGADPCPSTLEVEDASRAAPALVCAALHTGCTVVAVSGDTVLTPPAPGASADKPPIPLVYPRALTYSAGAAWDFASSPSPAAVLLNLGTNDQAVSTFNATYVPALVSFLAQLSSGGGYYGRAGLPIPRTLLYCGPMLFNYCGGMEEAAAQASAAGADVLFLGPVNATLDGCDGHPGPVGHAQMATQLEALVKGAMGW